MQHEKIAAEYAAQGYKVNQSAPDNYRKVWMLYLTKGGDDCQQGFKLVDGSEVSRKGYSEIEVIVGSREELDEYWIKKYNGEFATILIENFGVDVDYYSNQKLRNGVLNLVRQVLFYKKPDLCKRVKGLKTEYPN